MTEIAYGPKYAATKGMSRVEIAKLIRADIKAAVKAGTVPKGVYGVTCKSYSGGGSIDVKIKSLEVAKLYNEEHLALEASDPHYSYPRGERYTPEAKAAIDALTAIHGAYNYDGSDIQSDYFHVRYYGHVELDWEFADARKAAEIAALPKTEPTPPAPPPETKKVRHLTLVKPAPEPKPAAPENAHVDFLEAMGAL